ncbi:hypothetical protein DRJ25_02535 [Candidatus Woesearchaeota archaeon]|nr:MAG: hypothetical protein DRJ25_02535 [Candidatus Woesearchaeota archaeon]
MKYLVYVGRQRLRNGKVVDRVRVVRLRGLKSPRIVDKTLDKATRRGIVTIAHRVRMTARNGRHYYITKKFSLTLGDVKNLKSIKITSNPPPGPRMDFK